MKSIFRFFVLFFILLRIDFIAALWAQDPYQGLDMNSDAFTKAEMSRADIETLVVSKKGTDPVDLSGKSLNGLDLSGLDLRGVLLRAARLNKTKLRGAQLQGAALDAVWGLEADFSQANLQGASLIGGQFVKAIFNDANFSKAKVKSNFARASLVNARFDGADLSPGHKNQRAMVKRSFEGANLDGASFKSANLLETDFQFASMTNVDLTEAKMVNANLSGVTLSGADVTNTDFNGADLNSAKLLGIKNLDKAKYFDKVLNLDTTFR